MNFLNVSLLLFAAALSLSIAGVNMSAFLLGLAVLGSSKRAHALQALRSPLIGGLLAYVAVAFIAALASGAAAHSLPFAIKDLHKVVLAGILLSGLALAPRRRVFETFAAGAALAAVVGIYQALTGARGSGDGAFARAAGFVHPVVYGELMALALLGGVCRLTTPTPGKERRLWGAWTALICVALFFSQTRAAMLAAVVGALAAAAASRRWRAHAGKIVLAGLVLLAAWEFLPTGSRSFSAMARAAVSGKTTGDQFIRLSLWGTAERMFESSPLLGVGPGRYREHYKEFGGVRLDGEDVWGSAHNLYIHQLAERGIIGLATLLALFALLLWRAFDAARRRDDFPALWAWTATVAFMLMNLTETAFQSEQIASAFLFIWIFGANSDDKKL